MALENPTSPFESLRQINLPERPKNGHGWVFMIADLIAISVAWYVANDIYFRFGIHTTVIGPNQIPVFEIFSSERAIIWAGVILMLRQLGHYKDHIHYFFQLRSIFIVCCCGLIGESVLRLYVGTPTSTIGLIISWVLTAFLIMSLRALTSKYICSRDEFLQPVVLLTDGPIGRHAREAIKRKKRLGYKLHRVPSAEVNWSDLADRAISKGDHEAATELWSQAAKTDTNTLFLSSFDVFDHQSVRRVVTSLEALNRPFGFVTSQTGIRLPRFKEFPFFGEDLILLLPDLRGPSLASRFSKRLFDIVSSGLGLVFLAPLFLIFAVLIRRDGGPIFFVQERIGKNGKRFQCYKFRTMVVDAEARLQSLLDGSAEARREWDESQKLSNDPRIIPVGKWLRKGSLDEFPQLINVFKGEMSLVGPRPCFDDQVAQYGKRFDSYLAVRPGITGLWQVSGRNSTTFEERAELEAWYVENWSLWLDLFVLVKTVPVVLFGRGAY